MPDESTGTALDTDLITWLLVDFANGLDAASACARELAEGVRSGEVSASSEEGAAFVRMMEITCEWRKLVAVCFSS